MLTDLEILMYGLEAGLPHPLITVLVRLSNGDMSLMDTWDEWRMSDFWHGREARDRQAFSSAVEAVTGEAPASCASCHLWMDDDDSTTVLSGDPVCDGCLSEYYSTCGRCLEWELRDEMTHVHDLDEVYCEDCQNSVLSWCEDCEVYYRYDHEEHENSCDCEAPIRKFRFPATGPGTRSGSVKHDKRLTVVLPAGIIDDEGLRQIRQLLQSDTNALYAANPAMQAIGDEWQTRKGNYTRRLSSELYKNHQVKVGKDVLTKVGNIARQHSTDTTEWAIEFTRNLNLSAEAFGHEDSCWWQSYYESRCALKQWGGLGLRTFDEHDYVSGRAWVQPLNSTFFPTHDTLGAHAYLVYNCYGELSGAKGARIIAHLTGKTYRKISVHSDPQYVNGNTGWLVAVEATCQALGDDGLCFTDDCHHKYDADVFGKEISAA